MASGHLIFLENTVKPMTDIGYNIFKKESNSQNSGHNHLHQIAAASRVNVNQNMLHQK
jgi:hypothetical protein